MTKKKDLKRQPKTEVRILIFDSAKNDSPAEMEAVLTKIHEDPDKYEMISCDKNITPIGNLVMVLIYKQTDLPSLDLDDMGISDDLER